MYSTMVTVCDVKERGFRKGRTGKLKKQAAVRTGCLLAAAGRWELLKDFKLERHVVRSRF